MPNYTYNCVQCHEFTIKQSIHDNHDIATCPTCGNTAKRVFTSFQTYNMNPKVKRESNQGNNLGSFLEVNLKLIPHQHHDHKQMPDHGWPDINKRANNDILTIALSLLARIFIDI